MDSKELENIILDYLEKGTEDSDDESGGSQNKGLTEVGKVLASFQRFMRDITK